jgi:hypothetical protein
MRRLERPSSIDVTTHLFAHWAALPHQTLLVVLGMLSGLTVFLYFFDAARNVAVVVAVLGLAAGALAWGWKEIDSYALDKMQLSILEILSTTEPMHSQELAIRLKAKRVVVGMFVPGLMTSALSRLATAGRVVVVKGMYALPPGKNEKA